MTRIFIILLGVFFTSCASIYHDVHPEKQAYYDQLFYDSLEISYKYDINKLKRNNKIARKEKRKGYKIVALKIKNLSEDTIKFSNDVSLSINGRIIKPLNIEETYKLFKQHPWPYAFAIFTYTYSNVNGESSFDMQLNPFGIAYALTNIIIATNSNLRFSEQLQSYDVNNMIIPPYCDKYGLLCFSSSITDRIELNTFKDNKIQITDNTTNLNINSLIKYNDKFDSFDQYYDFLIKTFGQDKSFKEIELYKSEYKNGKIKSIGIKAKHDYGVNDYSYKIGTWRYFYNNGEVKEIINFNLREKKYDIYKSFSEKGQLIQESFYWNDLLILKYNDGMDISKGKATIIKINGEDIKCKILYQDLHNIYIETYINNSKIKTGINKEKVLKIVYKDKIIEFK